MTTVPRRQSQKTFHFVSSLQSDIQKILRNARKLPDKTPHFYKELNRLKRAALALGFNELLDGMATLFERECSVLPGSAHPVKTPFYNPLFFIPK
jgi:hypothetical protein